MTVFIFLDELIHQEINKFKQDLLSIVQNNPSPSSFSIFLTSSSSYSPSPSHSSSEISYERMIILCNIFFPLSLSHLILIGCLNKIRDSGGIPFIASKLFSKASLLHLNLSSNILDTFDIQTILSSISSISSVSSTRLKYLNFNSVPMDRQSIDAIFELLWKKKNDIVQIDLTNTYDSVYIAQKVKTLQFQFPFSITRVYYNGMEEGEGDERRRRKMYEPYVKRMILLTTICRENDEEGFMCSNQSHFDENILTSIVFSYFDGIDS
jgi:hypothetical protein